MDWINDLMALPKFGSGVGLHRMEFLCEDIQSTDWWADQDPINIVGTNGKGSTAAILASIFKNLGIPAGQFTSPHLFDFSERIQVNGDLITEKDLYSLIQSFFAQKDKYNQLFPFDHIGAFEAFTSIALHYFFQQATETMVLEAGIGGRFDPTRICTGHLVGLTSLDLEHTQLLGSTLEEIAMDKMDIATSGSTLILGTLDKEMIRKLRTYASLKKVNLKTIDEETEIHSIVYSNQNMIVDFSVGEDRFGPTKSKLLGQHQANNMLLAVCLAKEWIRRNRKDITEVDFVNAVKVAVNEINWPGRLEKISDEPEIFIDVGHTPKAIEELAKAAKNIIHKPILLIFGVSDDKDEEALLKGLLPIASSIIGTKAYHKGASPSRIKKAIETLRPKTIPFDIEANIDKALQQGIEEASSKGMTLLVAGSLFLAAEAKAAINGINPQHLDFF